MVLRRAAFLSSPGITCQGHWQHRDQDSKECLLSAGKSNHKLTFAGQKDEIQCREQRNVCISVRSIGTVEGRQRALSLLTNHHDWERT
jgi:hypothetical protein